MPVRGLWIGSAVSLWPVSVYILYFCRARWWWKWLYHTQFRIVSWTQVKHIKEFTIQTKINPMFLKMSTPRISLWLSRKNSISNHVSEIESEKNSSVSADCLLHDFLMHSHEDNFVLRGGCFHFHVTLKRGSYTVAFGECNCRLLSKCFLVFWWGPLTVPSEVRWVDKTWNPVICIRKSDFRAKKVCPN